MLTVLRFTELMQHAIGRTPAPGHNLRETFNEAGRKLVDRFNWSWKTAGPVTVTVAVGDEGKDYIPLDTAHGFTGFLSVEGITAGSQVVRLISPAEMLDAKARGGYTSPTFSIVTDDLPAALGTSLPTPRLWLLDTLAAGTAGTEVCKILYRRGWIDVATSGTGDDAKKPPIPDGWEEALKLLCRAMAYGMEFDHEHPDMERYEKVVLELIARDTTRQTYRGQIRGGAADTPAYLDPGMSGWMSQTQITGGP